MACGVGGGIGVGCAGGRGRCGLSGDGEVITKQFVGFGANVSPWVYCAPNWPGEVNETNVGDLERKVVELGVQHVRIFIKPEWWEGEKERAKGESVERLCRLVERAGGTVNLTLWGGVHDKGEEMGRRTAAVFRRLILEKKISCVRYATLQNEPNGFGMDWTVYGTLYRTFDGELKRLGVRDRVKIIGGDLLSTKQEEWFGMLARELSGVLDGYSVHMYSDYWDGAHMAKRLGEVMPIVAGLPVEGRKPVYLMEFGVRGHREPKEEPGRDEEGRRLYDLPAAGNLVAYHMVEAVNRGFVATCQWDLVDVMYNRSVMHYGVIGEAKDGFPLKPGYGVLKLFTHSAGPGWSVVKVEGAAEMRSVAVMKSPSGDWTVFAVNRAGEARDVTISGLAKGMTFHERVWNGEGNGRDVVASGEGEMRVSLPGMSVVALTTRAE